MIRYFHARVFLTVQQMDLGCLQRSFILELVKRLGLMYNKVKVTFVKMVQQNARIHYPDNPTNRSAASIGELLLKSHQCYLQDASPLCGKFPGVFACQATCPSGIRRHCFTNFALGPRTLRRARPVSFSWFCNHRCPQAMKGRTTQVQALELTCQNEVVK